MTNPTEENLNKVSSLIDKYFEDREERNQAQNEIQVTTDFKVVKGVLDNLPENKHDEFLKVFTENPDDGDLVAKYLKDNGIEDKINDLLSDISNEIVNDLTPDKEIVNEIHSEGKVPVK